MVTEVAHLVGRYFVAGQAGRTLRTLAVMQGTAVVPATEVFPKHSPTDARGSLELAPKHLHTPWGTGRNGGHGLPASAASG